MTPPPPRSRVGIAVACAASSLAHGCHVDLEPSPCERTEPYVTAADLYPAGGPAACDGGDTVCLLVTEASPEGVGASSGRLIYSLPTGLVAWVRADGTAGQPPQSLTPAAAAPYAVAARGDLMSWVSGTDSKLWLQSLQEPTNYFSPNNLVDDCIAFDGDRIYITRHEAGRIGSVLAAASGIADQCCCKPADNGCCTTPAMCSDGVDLLIDGRINPHGTTALGGSIYWAEAGMLRRISADGGGEQALVAVSNVEGCMAAGSELVFYADKTGGAIWAYSTVGGCRVPIVSGVHTSMSHDAPFSVAVDDRHLYWTSLEGVWRMPRPF